MGSVWLIWLDFDLKVDSNTGGGGGREEEGSGEPEEPEIYTSVARNVRYSPGNPDTAGELGKLITLRERADKKSKATAYFFLPLS